MNTMRYYRVMLGKKSIHARVCIAGQFIGIDFLPDHDLTALLPEDWREFNREFIPRYLEQYPNKTRISAGLGCGALWTVSKGIHRGDIVLCPDAEGHYQVGEVIGDYTYRPQEILPHRHAVKGLNTINRADMSDNLKNSAGSVGTVADVSKHHAEIGNMGYVQEELATEKQHVRGIIIALEDDKKLRRALSMTPNIEFYRY